MSMLPSLSIFLSPHSGYEVFLLCLSSGNFDGLGSVRKVELEAAGVKLGIQKSNIFIEDFQDNPDLVWDENAIALTLQRSVK